MRFYCRNCQKSIEEERIDQARLKEYKSGKMPLMTVVCPDCGCGTLEGGGSMMVVCPYCSFRSYRDEGQPCQICGASWEDCLNGSDEF